MTTDSGASVNDGIQKELCSPSYASVDAIGYKTSLLNGASQPRGPLAAGDVMGRKSPHGYGPPIQAKISSNFFQQ